MAQGGLPWRTSTHAPMFWRAAVLEGGIAALILVAPPLFGSPVYAPLQRYLPELAILCLAGGAFALAAVSGLLSPRMQAAAAAFASLPALALATNFVLAGTVTGIITWGIEAAALVCTAVLVGREQEPRARVYVLMVGTILAAQGVCMVVAPSLFANAATYAQLGGYLAIAAPAFIVAGVGLVIAELRSARRAGPFRSEFVLAFSVLAALDLAVLVGVFAATGAWTGVLSYGVMAVVLLLAAPRGSVGVDSPILFACIAGIAALGDLATAVAVTSGAPALAPLWTVMRPSVAIGVAIVAAGFAIAFHPGRPLRRLTAVLGILALLEGLASTAISIAQGAGDGPEALLGLTGDNGIGLGTLSSPVALSVAAVVLLVLVAWPGGRAVAALLVVSGSTLSGVVALNLLAFMLQSSFLLDVYGPLGMRQHATVAFGALSMAVLAAGIARLLQAPIGDRLLGALAALGVLTIIRGYVADAALSHVFADPADLARPAYLTAVGDARQLTLVLLLAVAAGAAMLLTRTVTLPLRALLDAIARARAGEQRAQADVEGDDEIGIVARSFNQLTRELADQADLAAAVRRAQSDLGEAIVLLEDGEPRQWNEALSTITGYTDTDLHAMPSVFDLLPKGERNKVREFATTRGRDTFRFESAIVRRSGERADLEVAVIPMRDMPTTQVAIVRDISERKTAERALERLALHDALTGLPNRALFADRLDRTIAAATRSQDSFTLLYLDLDRFKEVNDAFGHDAGDELLSELSRRIGRPLTSADTLARFGGDEFAILLPRARDLVEGTAMAEVIRAVLERPFELLGHRVFVEASIGLVLFPNDGTDADTLLRRADIAMYQAKHTGKGVIAYATEHDPQSQRRLDLMSDLRHAIDRHELSLHYQPQVRLGDGGCCGSIEALVRWRHPERGMVPPVDFIPLAENSGFINELALWVIREGMSAAASLAGISPLPLRLALNVSARNLHYPGLVDAVDAGLRAARLDPSVVTIEITETAVMSDAQRSLDTLARLSALGVRLSIDDFGAGYSSLAYLRRLPVNELKIDRTFVADMLANPSSDAIVSSVIQLGHSLGLSVVAEGVEDASTLAALAARRCDLAQGYHIARPMPLEQLTGWLRLRGSSVEIPTAAE